MKINKVYKIRPMINHSNELFREGYSIESDQSIDDQMTKFEGRSSIKQYIKFKTNKMEPQVMV